MKILIQDAQIFHAGSPDHKKTRNILIANGKIASIGTSKPAADRVIQAKGCKLSVGWFDLGTFIGDPGYEAKEDLESGTRAAMSGGFTGLATLPNTKPAVQSKNEVAYLLRGNRNRLVQIYPMAAVTLDTKGEELTEMIDLHEAGAVAFTDGIKPLWHTDIFLKSLQYLQRFGALLIERPEDLWLNMYGQMHEGKVSTALGLKGMPSIAEEVMISRDVQLLAYAGGRLHFSRISSGKSLAEIKSAKTKLKVSCDMAVYQPLLDDRKLESFDTNYKVSPPLREAGVNKVLIKGLVDGTIDVLSSGHMPHEEESKNLEFDQAEFGMATLQTFGSHLQELSGSVAWEDLIEKVTTTPRALLGLEQPALTEGAEANLTLFDPTQRWTLDHKTNRSKARNSPWFGTELEGRVVAVFNNGHHYIDLPE